MSDAPLRIHPGTRVRVRVPATSANLGPGFDTLGLALAVYDELEVEALAAGELEILVQGMGEGEVPLDDSHLVVQAIGASLRTLGAEVPGLRLTARNLIPHGRGLGSSGAAIVSGVMAAAGLLADQRHVSREELLALATTLEGHPDNVAPCLFGGLTIAWTNPEGAPQSKELLVHRGVSPAIFIPEATMSTKVARSLQPANVPHEDAIFNVSRSALLIAALTQSPELMLEATEDRLHQRYRASAMPQTAELVQALREAGLPAVVSGAGPSVLVLCTDPLDRQRAAQIADSLPEAGWQAMFPAVDFQGATLEVVSAETASLSA